MIWLYGVSYVVWDNIELKGWLNASGDGGYIAVNGTNTEIKNMYIHGWSISSGQGNSDYAITAQTNNGYPGTGTYFHDNVIDGADTSQNTMNGFGQGDHIYNNVVRYVVSGLLIGVNDFHSNLVEDSVTSVSGDHCNMFFAQGTLSGTTMYVYNNVFRHELCSGGSVMWATSTSGCASCMYYLFNNVAYDIASSFGAFSCGYHASAGNTGTCYMYNETLDLGGGAGGTAFGNGESGAASKQHYSNVHLIGASSYCSSTGATCINDGGNLMQTESQANSASYTANETYAYSPVSASGPTVSQGVNHSSMCSGSLAAICQDTSYPEYNTVNHTVTLRTENSRPSTLAWDIGAYELSGGATGGTVASPTSLSATVQ